MRGDVVEIHRQLLIHQHPRPIGPAPPVDQRMGSRPAAAQVIPLHSRPREDRGNGVRVAERIGLPVQRDIRWRQTEVFGHVRPRVEQMPRQRLAAGQVLVAFDPMDGGHFPPALGHALLDPRKQLRVVHPNDLVDRRLRLREAELRKFLHQRQHGGEGVTGDGDGFRPRPHPVHVDMGVADAVDGVLLGGVGQRGQQLLGLLDGSLQAPILAGGQGRPDQFLGLVGKLAPVRLFLQLRQAPRKLDLRFARPGTSGRPGCC